MEMSLQTCAVPLLTTASTMMWCRWLKILVFFALTQNLFFSFPPIRLAGASLCKTLMKPPWQPRYTSYRFEMCLSLINRKQHHSINFPLSSRAQRGRNTCAAAPQISFRCSWSSHMKFHWVWITHLPAGATRTKSHMKRRLCQNQDTVIINKTKKMLEGCLQHLISRVDTYCIIAMSLWERRDLESPNNQHCLPNVIEQLSLE